MASSKTPWGFAAAPERQSNKDSRGKKRSANPEAEVTELDSRGVRAAVGGAEKSSLVTSPDNYLRLSHSEGVLRRQLLLVVTGLFLCRDSVDCITALHLRLNQQYNMRDGALAA